MTALRARIGVLGGGLQGCCAALALADRGADVVLFDRNDALITKAGAANEGKIHLGYMYAGNPDLRTARTMLTGALAFEPFLRRHLGAHTPALATSMPAAYAVHRETQRTPDDISGYLEAAHALVREAAAAGVGSYFGMDLTRPLRRWSPDERATNFDPNEVLDVYETPEVAINPMVVAEAVRHTVTEHPNIEVRLGTEIVAADDEPGRVRITGRTVDGEITDAFDQVVNALWDGRLALNEQFGLATGRDWIHRLKYGVSFRLPPGAPVPPSTTFVLGPFGEVVSYGEGLTYLTWYPTCLREITRDLTPPDWPNFPTGSLRENVLDGTVRAMGNIVRALADLDPAELPEAMVKGGAIVAWGATDIDDPGSELHRRYEIGLTSKGRFHSLDPGKLTMAPHFAEQCAERLLG